MPQQVNQSMPLGYFRSKSKWMPRIGDFIIWSGFFRTSYGLVAGFDAQNVRLVIEGLPNLLLTLTDQEQQQQTKLVSLSKIIGATAGVFCISQYDQNAKANIWYL